MTRLCFYSLAHSLTRSLACFVFSLFLCSISHAGAGKTACQFLKIHPSARAAGMANVSPGSDVFSLYSNPAALAGLEKAEMSATYLRYFADINYGFVGYASPLSAQGVFGIGYTYLLVSDIEKRDVNETRLGTFNAKDISLAAAYARGDVVPSILENLDAGASVKVVSSEIDQTIAYTVAADLSASYHATDKVTTSLALQNLSYGIRFNEVTDPLPLDLKLAVTYRPSDTLTVGSEIDEYFIDNKFYAGLGGEYWAAKQFALRGGYRFGYDTESLGSTAGLSFGVGFRIWSVGMDYAFVPFGELGDTHRISFNASF